MFAKHSRSRSCLIDEVDIMEIQKRSAWNYGGRLMTEKQAFSCIRTSARFYPRRAVSQLCPSSPFSSAAADTAEAVADSSTLST